MSKNIDQVFIANPITSNAATDLMYFGQSPYASGDDAAMTYANFAAQFGSKSQVQSSSFNVGIDTGTANAYIVTLTPAPASLTNGLVVEFTALNSSTTTTPTINVNGLGAKTIKRPGNLPMVSGDILSNSITYLAYSVADTAFIIINPVISSGGGGVTSTQVQQSAFNIGVDSGAADAYVVTLSPAISAITDGLIVSFTVGNTNATTTPTIDVGTGAQGIFLLGAPGTINVMAGDLQAGYIANLYYDDGLGGFFLVNPFATPLTGVTPEKVQQVVFNTGNDTGVADAYAVALNPTATSYTLGMTVSFVPDNNNTIGSPTLNVDGLGAVGIVSANGNGLIKVDDIQGSISAYFVYTSSGFVLLNPANSAFQTAPLPSDDSTLAIGSAYQNTLGYDVVIVVYLQVTSATSAGILLGVGGTNTPTQQTIVSGLSLLATGIIPVTIYLPNNYYALLSTSGTITAAISGQIVMPV